MSETLDIREKDQGVLVAVKARAGGKKNSVNGIHAGALKVEVTIAPEKGKANKAIIKQLAKFFEISPSRITLISGETNSHKSFLLSDITEKVVRQIICEAGF